MREKKRPRITAAQVAEVQALRAAGLTLAEIAAALGISVNSACRHSRPRRSYARHIAAASAPVAAFIRPPSLARLMGGR